MFHINDNNYFTTVMNKGQVLFTFTDTLNDGYNLSSFKREIIENKIKKTFIYSGGKLLFYLEDKKAKFIEKIKKDFKISPKFLTLDIETRDIDGKKKFLFVCLFMMEKKLKHFYLNILINDRKI
jgi:hypothetical protein